MLPARRRLPAKVRRRAGRAAEPDRHVDSQSAAIAVGPGAGRHRRASRSWSPRRRRTRPAEGKLAEGRHHQERSTARRSTSSTQAVPTSSEACRRVTRSTLGIERNGKHEHGHDHHRASPDDQSKSRIGVDASRPTSTRLSTSTSTSGKDIGGPSAGTDVLARHLRQDHSRRAHRRQAHRRHRHDRPRRDRRRRSAASSRRSPGPSSSGATVFLVPADNCAEAGGSPYKDDIELIKVTTIDDAVKALDALDAGDGADDLRRGADE